jgi:hypothetical protein
MEEMVIGLPQIDHVDQVCGSCLTGKWRCLLFPSEAKYRASFKLEHVHRDLCGPVTPVTPARRHYFFLLVDDLSRFTWLVLLNTKDEATITLETFQARTEVEAGRKLGILRIDRGGEFTTRNFLDHCIEHCIQCHLTAPYTPEQNRVVERRNHSVMGMARSMLKAMSVPGWLSGGIAMAVFILNWSPTQSVDGKMPYEVRHGAKPIVHFFRTFGCVAHVKQGSKKLGKLDDRSTPMVFIGFEPGAEAWRLYNPVTKRVHVSRDAIFEEDKPWRWDGEDVGNGESFGMEYVQAGEASCTMDMARPHSPAVSLAPAYREPSVHTPLATPPNASPDLDAEAEDAPLRFRRVDDVLGPAPGPRLADR